MTRVAELAFWLAAAWVAWALVLYPALAIALGSLPRRRRAATPGAAAPRVSFIISAYNEERSIGEKVRDTLALDYPPDRLEVIVASDGSTDRTDDVVREIGDPRVVLHRVEGRVGKTAALNSACAAASGDVFVFSDATGKFSKDALRVLASALADPAVGCVAGRVVYRYGRDATSEGFKGYQRIAVAIRRAESRFGDQTSVSGSIHAVRRECFRPSPPHASPDVLDAVHAVVAGRRVLYAAGAVSVEESRSRPHDEFRARVRISIQNNGMARYVLRELVRARRWFYLFQMVSHKMMRWWLWAPLLVLLVSSLVLAPGSPWYAAAAVVQLGGYALAVAGVLAGPASRWLRPLSLPGFFVVGNAAMCVGTFRYLLGAEKAAWEPQREEG